MLWSHISEEGGGKRRGGGIRSPVVHDRNVGSTNRRTDVSNRRGGIAFRGCAGVGLVVRCRRQARTGKRRRH